MKNLQKIFNGTALTIEGEAGMVELGTRISTRLEAGDVLGFVGDLGAGKTHLIQGILQGLGVSDPAASPTFSLVHEHTGGRLPAAHFDFYRMKEAAEALGIGWDEYLDSGSVLLVEWADRFDGSLMPRDTHWFVLRHLGPTTRSVSSV